MRTDSIYFDCETGPLPEELLAKVRPPANLKKVKNIKDFGKPFDPMTVKLGRMVDPVKIEKKIAEAAAKWPDLQERIAEEIEETEQKHVEDFAEKAALDACRGQLLAAGYLSTKELIDGRSEPEMLIKFWDVFNTAAGDGRKLIGFNIFGFDLPFLIRRSWVHGVHVPAIIDKNRYWHECFIDLAEVYRLGCHGEFKSLGEMCVAMGLGEKLDGISGADFHKLWADDREKAKEYLGRDLLLTKNLAERILPNAE